MMAVMVWVGVAVAGALGAVARYGLGVIVGPRHFPWTTLGINVAGCFLLALLLTGPAADRLSPTTATALSVGLLGAFTTFSTFGYETVTLLRDERLEAAAVYALVSLLLGVGAAAAGYWLGDLWRS